MHPIGNRDRLDCPPQVLTLPVLAGFAVKRAVQPVQPVEGVRQRHEALQIRWM